MATENQPSAPPPSLESTPATKRRRILAKLSAGLLTFGFTTVKIIGGVGLSVGAIIGNALRNSAGFVIAVISQIGYTLGTYTVAATLGGLHELYNVGRKVAGVVIGSAFAFLIGCRKLLSFVTAPFATFGLYLIAGAFSLVASSLLILRKGAAFLGSYLFVAGKYLIAGAWAIIATTGVAIGKILSYVGAGFITAITYATAFTVAFFATIFASIRGIIGAVTALTMTTFRYVTAFFVALSATMAIGLGKIAIPIVSAVFTGGLYVIAGVYAGLASLSIGLYRSVAGIGALLYTGASYALAVTLAIVGSIGAGIREIAAAALSLIITAGSYTVAVALGIGATIVVGLRKVVEVAISITATLGAYLTASSLALLAIPTAIIATATGVVGGILNTLLQGGRKLAGKLIGGVVGFIVGISVGGIPGFKSTYNRISTSPIFGKKDFKLTSTFVTGYKILGGQTDIKLPKKAYELIIPINQKPGPLYTKIYTALRVEDKLKDTYGRFYHSIIKAKKPNSKDQRSLLKKNYDALASKRKLKDAPGNYYHLIIRKNKKTGKVETARELLSRTYTTLTGKNKTKFSGIPAKYYHTIIKKDTTIKQLYDGIYNDMRIKRPFSEVPKHYWHLFVQHKSLFNHLKNSYKSVAGKTSLFKVPANAFHLIIDKDESAIQFFSRMHNGMKIEGKLKDVPSDSYYDIIDKKESAGKLRNRIYTEVAGSTSIKNSLKTYFEYIISKDQTPWGLTQGIYNALAGQDTLKESFEDGYDAMGGNKKPLGHYFNKDFKHITKGHTLTKVYTAINTSKTFGKKSWREQSSGRSAYKRVTGVELAEGFDGLKTKARDDFNFILRRSDQVIETSKGFGVGVLLVAPAILSDTAAGILGGARERGTLGVIIGSITGFWRGLTYPVRNAVRNFKITKGEPVPEPERFFSLFRQDLSKSFDAKEARKAFRSHKYKEPKALAIPPSPTPNVTQPAPILPSSGPQAPAPVNPQLQNLPQKHPQAS